MGKGKLITSIVLSVLLLLCGCEPKESEQSMRIIEISESTPVPTIEAKVADDYVTGVLILEDYGVINDYEKMRDGAQIYRSAYGGTSRRDSSSSEGDGEEFGSDSGIEYEDEYVDGDTQYDDEFSTGFSDDEPIDEAELEGQLDEYGGYAEDGYSDGFADESEMGYDDGDEYYFEDGGLTYLGTWASTGYCPGSCCCGEWATGYTASGTLATEGVTVACGSLPMGTTIYIEGWGYRVVEDLGVEGEWVDIFYSLHEAASAHGLQYVNVYLVN